jgi:glycosyltransferase involved in cell wall biosynthesis
MRIGIFHATLPDPGRKPGGVDVHVHRLAEHLLDAGHYVRVISASSPPAGARYDHVPPPFVRLWSRLVTRLFVAPLTLNRLDTSDLDVLHLHGDDWFFVRRGVPTVRTLHGRASHEARAATKSSNRALNWMTVPLEHLAVRLATATYSVSPDSIAEGCLPCGVDIEPSPAGPDERARAILFVGTWDGRKRGRDLWRSFVEEVRPTDDGAELWMVSDACEPADGVVWFDRPSDVQLKELFRRAAIFCLPSSYEGLGIPYLEAMGAGAVAVATPNPGARFVLAEGRFGVLVDLEALGSTLVDLLGDDGRRGALAEAGLGRAREFSWPRVVADHEEAYERAIERFSERRRS